MLRKILTNTFFYSLANQVPALVNLFLLPILTPHLTSNDYAIYGLSLAYTGLVGAFSSLGYIVNFQNSYFHDGDSFKGRWSRMLGFQWVYKIGYSGLVTLILWYFIGQKLSGKLLVYVILLVVIPVLFFDLTKSIGTRLCQYRHEHKKVYLISIVTALVSIVSTLIGILHFHLGFVAWLISSALASGIQALYFGYILYVREGIKPQFAFHASEIREDLRVALPFIPKDYASYIMSSSDRVILDRNHVHPTAIGQYNIAYSFAGYFENVQMQANQVMTPIFFGLFKANSNDSNTILSKYVKLWFGMSLLIASFIALWIPELFHALYRKKELSDGYPLAAILIFAFCFRPLYVAAVDRAFYEKRTGIVLKITVISAMLNLIINLIFIPYYGVWAAAISTVLSYLMLAISGYLFTDSNRKIFKELRPDLLLLVLIITTIGVCIMTEFDWKLKVVITLIFSGAAIIWYFLKGKKLVHYLNMYHQQLQ